MSTHVFEVSSMAEVVPTANVDMMPSAVCSKQHARQGQSVCVRSTPQK